MSVTNFCKIPEFNGDAKKFPVWASKMQALLTVKGIAETSIMGFKLQMAANASVVLDPKNAAEMLQIQAKVKNDLAMSYFAMALASDELLCMIEEVKTTDWPGGLACELWKELQDEFKPNDTIAKAEQLKKLMELKLSKGEDPKKFGGRMAMIQNMYGCTLDESHKIAVVVRTSGKNYASADLSKGRSMKK